ncbi:MAG TPA: hypothetical protein VEA16_22060 [Vicinamibacterales bacterium]|nr:hypothetical protein [Vicinamibacterales bacterium]
MTSLVRSDGAEGDLDQLRARVSELETLLQQRLADADRMKAELTAFRITYRRRVGRLHEELDELEQAITAAELGILSERVTHQQPTDDTAAPIREVQPRSLTSDTMRRLFRDVAKAIHPDLAPDADARDVRHRLMIEANRAYAQGDEERLKWILDSWERGPDAFSGSDGDAMRARLTRRIAQMEGQLAGLGGALADLQQSSLWKLKAMVDDEAARGRDLMADMIRRLNRDILIARNRLDAVRSMT